MKNHNNLFIALWECLSWKRITTTLAVFDPCKVDLSFRGRFQTLYSLFSIFWHMFISVLVYAWQHQILTVVSVIAQHVLISFTGNAFPALDQTDSALAMVHLPGMPHCSCNLWLNPLCHSTVSFLVSICLSFQSFLNNGDAVIAFEMSHKLVISIFFPLFFSSSPLCQSEQLEDTVRGIDNLFQLFSWSKYQWFFCMFPCLLSTLTFCYFWQK